MNCSFCGEAASSSWAHVAGEPGWGICDRCVYDLRDAAALSSGEPTSPMFGPCRFCGGEGPAIVGSARTAGGEVPVICHDCVAVAAPLVDAKVRFDDPWYLPLRDEAGGWVAPGGADAGWAWGPGDLAAVDAWAAQRLDELAAMGLPADGDVPAIVRRKAVAARLGERAAAEARLVGVDEARRVAEGWFRG